MEVGDRLIEVHQDEELAFRPRREEIVLVGADPDIAPSEVTNMGVPEVMRVLIGDPIMRASDEALRGRIGAH